MKSLGLPLLLGLLLSALAAAAGCGDDEEPSTSTGQPQGLLCEGETRAEAFAPGMEKVAESGVRVRLTDVTVEGVGAEPDRGFNTWRFELLDDAMAPLEQAELSFRTWMPDHGHGTSPNDLAAAPVDGESGVYEVGPFDLFMGGFWTFDVTVGDAEPVQFAFCLEG